jgi:hypothetical protein
MATRTYSAKEVIATVNGVIISGFADGDSIVVEFNDDAWRDAAGNDGEVARSKVNDPRGTITLTLLQTSISNDFLNGLATVDQLTGLAQLSVQIRDLRGTSLAFSNDAWILRTPTKTYGRDVGNTEWPIRCGNLQSSIGGNF